MKTSAADTRRIGYLPASVSAHTEDGEPTTMVVSAVRGRGDEATDALPDRGASCHR